MIASSLAAIPLTIALIPAASIEEEGINCYNKGILGQTSSKTLCNEYYTQRIFNAEYILYMLLLNSNIYCFHVDGYKS